MASKSGKMRERITFQENTQTEDTYAGLSYAFGNISATPTMWARVEPISEREKATRAKLDTRWDWKITCRYRADITTAMQIIWRGRTLAIIGPPRNVDERDRFIEIMCLEGGKP